MTRFVVSIEWNRKGQWVAFRFDRDRIMATDQTGREVALVAVTMTQGGSCGISLSRDDGATPETWEFRLRALEHLFFVAPESA